MSPSTPSTPPLPPGHPRGRFTGRLPVLPLSVEGATPILPRGKLRPKAARLHGQVELQMLALPFCPLLWACPLPSAPWVTPLAPGVGEFRPQASTPLARLLLALGGGWGKVQSWAWGSGRGRREGWRPNPPEAAPGGEPCRWGMGRTASWSPKRETGCGFKSPHFWFTTVWPWSGNSAGSPNLSFPSYEKRMLLWVIVKTF